ncbi:hypothetical protein Trydic_g1886 [Trypoxylus dichotomus]
MQIREQGQIAFLRLNRTGRSDDFPIIATIAPHVKSAKEEEDEEAEEEGGGERAAPAVSSSRKLASLTAQIDCREDGFN